MKDPHEPKKYEYLADNPDVKVLPIMLSIIIGAFLRF